jgi:DNA-binding transcriptional regulator LsrR (DeoR family)
VPYPGCHRSPWSSSPEPSRSRTATSVRSTSFATSHALPAARPTSSTRRSPFATARALREQPEVAQAFSQLPRVTKAVAGVGFWGPGESTLYDAAEEPDRQALRQLGVCADISGVFLSADGEPIKADLTERMIGIDAEQMRAIPEVIVIAFGMAKVPAMRAVLRSGLIHGVVTHTALAQALLEVT